MRNSECNRNTISMLLATILIRIYFRYIACYSNTYYTTKSMVAHNEQLYFLVG